RAGAGMQAIRGVWRFSPTAATCPTGGFDDKDDLTFLVAPSSDTTPPTVALTSPAAGATLQNTVQVTASASDDRAVSRVDFFDGTALIASDTVAPFSVSWNTRAGANGGHTLTAVAFDAAGNSASAAISVSVDNDLSPPVVS